MLHRCYIFYKLKATPPTSKRIMAYFIVIFTLLQWSETKPIICWRYLCMNFLFVLIEPVVKIK